MHATLIKYLRQLKVPRLSTDANGNTTGLVGANGASLKISSKSIGSRAIFIGTSVTNQGFGATYYDAKGWFVPMNIALGWPFTTLIDAAVSGQSTSDMLANWDTTVANNYDNFDVAFIEIGPNDANGPTVASATTITNVETMTNTLLGQGKTVVLLTPTTATSPSATAHTTQAELDHMSAVAAWVKDFAENKENVFVADAGRVFSEPDDGYPNSTMASDGCHPSYPGAAVIGKEVARVVPLTRPVSRATSIRRDHKEYGNNPFFNGAYASGTRGYQAGTGVTGSGPESVAVGVTGTFTSVTVSKGSSLDDNSSSLIITVVGATSNWDAVNVRIGSNNGALTGTTQRGRHDQNWAAATTYTVGDYARHSTITDGILCCVAVVAGDTGASGGTQPTPTAGAYGEIITDNGVIWMWQKLPAVGDVFYAESEYSITGLTGGIAPKFGFTVTRDGSAGDLFGSGQAPYFDISGASGNPPTTWPLSGRVMTPEVTLVTPPNGAIAVRHVWMDWNFYFTAGGAATIEIPYASLRIV